MHIWESALAGPLSRLGVNVERSELSFDATAAEREALSRAAKNVDTAVFLVDFRNRTGQCQPLSEHQTAAVEAVAQVNRRTVAVATNPYVLETLGFVPALMATYGGSEESDRVAAEILTGQRRARGTLPVNSAI